MRNEGRGNGVGVWGVAGGGGLASLRRIGNGQSIYKLDIRLVRLAGRDCRG